MEESKEGLTLFVQNLGIRGLVDQHREAGEVRPKQGRDLRVQLDSMRRDRATLEDDIDDEAI